MIPYPSNTLADLAMRVARDIAPTTNNPFSQADSALVAGLLLSMAQDYERSIYNPMTDIDEIKQLCKDILEAQSTAQHHFPGVSQCEAFLDRVPSSLRLADVIELHASALQLLEDIHIWAEQHDPALNRSVWQLLRRHSERNKFDVPGP